MARVFGDVYSGFVAVSGSVLGLALLALIAAGSASGKVPAPRLRALHDGPVLPVLGANIDAVPAGASLQPVAAYLKYHVKNLPLGRALIRRHAGEKQVAVDSIFIPAGDMAEAFALCARLAHVPSDCAPVVASSDQLRTPDGSAVDEAGFAKFGITPYAPSTGRWTKVVSAVPAITLT